MGAEQVRREQPAHPVDVLAGAPRSSALRVQGVLGATEVLALQRVGGNGVVARAVRSGRIRPVNRVLARVPLVANPLDDPAAYKDAPSAAKALDAYVALSAADRRAAVAGSYKKDLVRVLQALSPADRVQRYRAAIGEICRTVQEEETRASAGMTDEGIAATQQAWLKKKAEDAAAAEAAKKAPVKGPPPKPTQAEVTKQLEKQVESTSIKGSTASGWDALSGAEKTAWETRAKAAITKVVAHAAAKHPELALKATHFRVAFKDVEKRGAGVVAFGEADGAGGTRAAIGFAFVTAVELNPAYVMDVVVHEVAGHPEYGVYGTEYHLALYDAAMAKMPGYAKPAAGTPARRTEIDAYAYQETEMYSVLRSMPYRTAPTAADVGKVPNLDTQTIVNWRVGLIKAQWAPSLVVAILRGYRRRLVIDPRVSGAALGVFDKSVDGTFDPATASAIKK